MPKKIKNENLVVSHRPKISVIIPLFNKVSYIEETLRTLVSQNYPNLEVIIEDGGSRDGSLEVVKKFAKKYPKQFRWSSQKDKGQSDAINKGLKKATGEILTYLNADDVYKENCLIKVSEFFNLNPNARWLFGLCDIIDEKGKEIRQPITKYKNYWLRKKFNYNNLLILNFISQMACFFRKDAYIKVGGFSLNQNYVLDYEYWLRLGKEYQPGFIDQYLASFRIGPKTKSSEGFVKQFKDEFEVSKKFTNNKLVIFLHLLHFRLIITSYQFLKYISKFKRQVL